MVIINCYNMPKYMSYRKKRRGASRRRKSFGKRKPWSRGRNKFAKADGYHKEKIIYDQTLRAVGNESQFFFHWLRPRDLAAADGTF